MIDGVTAYSPVALFPVYRGQLGQPISSESARHIVAEIEAMYMRDGYSRPEFRLQNDLVGSGVLQIEVFEARLSGIEVEGNAGTSPNTHGAGGFPWPLTSLRLNGAWAGGRP